MSGADRRKPLVPMRAPPNIRSQTRPTRALRSVRWLTAAHAVGVVALWFLIWEVSESHWLGSVATFLPRLPWLLPGALLLIASLFARSKLFWINLVTTLFVLFAVAEFNVPWRQWTRQAAPTARDERTLRVVSCNVQNFAPDFSVVL